MGKVGKSPNSSVQMSFSVLMLPSGLNSSSNMTQQNKEIQVIVGRLLSLSLETDVFSEEHVKMHFFLIMFHKSVALL